MVIFQVQSAHGRYKDVVAFYPMRSMRADDLYKAILEVLSRLAKLGLNVIALISDGLQTNVKAYALLCGGRSLEPQILNPVTGRPLFLIFDPVHIFKNLYNHLQRKKTLTFPAIPGTSSSAASFQ